MKAWLVTLLLIASCGGAPRRPGPGDPVRLTIQEARRIALDRYPGSVVRSRRETEGGRQVYSITIRTFDGDPTKNTEVAVDAQTGEIVGIELEDRPPPPD